VNIQMGCYGLENKAVIEFECVSPCVSDDNLNYPIVRHNHFIILCDMEVSNGDGSSGEVTFSSWHYEQTRSRAMIS
jgi:hypothetical protein